MDEGGTHGGYELEGEREGLRRKGRPWGTRYKVDEGDPDQIDLLNGPADT